MLVENMKDEEVDMLSGILPNTKTKVFRELVATSGNIETLNLAKVIRQYIKLRPKDDF